MTLSAVFFFIVGLAVAFLVGVGFACFRHRDKLKPRTVMQSIVRALGGGGGGPAEPF